MSIQLNLLIGCHSYFGTRGSNPLNKNVAKNLEEVKERARRVTKQSETYIYAWKQDGKENGNLARRSLDSIHPPPFILSSLHLQPT
jgi:hypothetical protein